MCSFVVTLQNITLCRQSIKSVYLSNLLLLPKSINLKQRRTVSLRGIPLIFRYQHTKFRFQCLMRLAAGLSRHKPLFNYRPGHVWLVMDRIALGQIVFQYFGLLLLFYGNVIKRDNGLSLKAFQQDRYFFRKIVSSGFKGYNTIVLLPCLP